jgi:hypothetical protein
MTLFAHASSMQRMSTTALSSSTALLDATLGRSGIGIGTDCAAVIVDARRMIRRSSITARRGRRRRWPASVASRISDAQTKKAPACAGAFAVRIHPGGRIRT